MFAQKNVALGQSPTAAVAANYIEDVFSTYLHSGSGTSTTLNVGVDLSTYGGLVWSKTRSGANSNALIDTARGVNQQILTNTTAAQNATYTDRLTAFTNTGFTLGADASGGEWNQSGYTYVKWTFRKQAKFFDVVTYTGNGSNRTISHNLGSVPGCIIVKSTSNAEWWAVQHVSLGPTKTLYLNSTNAQETNTTNWNNAAPTATEFTVGTNTPTNASGQTYVAYLFAHDAGGFGLTGSDNVISCGGFTYNATAGNTVDLGFEPQFVLVKNASATGSWVIQDSMRGMTADNTGNRLFPNSSAAEDTSGYVGVTSTGFKVGASLFTDGNTIIYIAIRRGPMKVPTSGTSVFSPNISSGAVGTAITTNFPVDMQINSPRDITFDKSVVDRLRGVITTPTDTLAPRLRTNLTNAEGDNFYSRGWNNTGFQMPSTIADVSDVFWSFQRAPSFFDVVCYTGTGSATTFNHNLAAVPELMLVKQRTASPAGTSFTVYSATMGNTGVMFLNSDGGNQGPDTQWNSTTPTASVFSVGTNLEVNGSGSTYVAYLFASCSGVSKVGSYTGTGTTLQVDCGFAAGARFVLIKRVGTGDWYVWDSARGIVAGNDPYLLLNSTAAEVTNTDYVDTYSAGFEISSTAPANVNASNATFIFLAIA